MTNLIPLSAEKNVKREYWLRVLSVWFVAVGIGVSVLIVLTLPIYVLVTLQLDNHSDTVVVASAQKDELQALEGVLREANRQARLIVSEQQTVSLTQHIQIITAIAGIGVTITSFQFDQTGEQKKLVLSGVADSRLLLANFRDNLENSENYSQVELPLSSLIRDRDIDFTMTMVVNEIGII